MAKRYGRPSEQYRYEHYDPVEAGGCEDRRSAATAGDV
jgi:hypothetical protein